MKAVTILQPWAMLIVLREKKFETRSWRTSYRGEIAIHAGKKVDRDACEREPIKSTLAKHGYTADNLPTGAVLAVGKLLHCYKSAGAGNGVAVLYSKNENVVGNELHFGDFATGRYAWDLTDVRRLPEPIPAKGQQRLWNWEGQL